MTNAELSLILKVYDQASAALATVSGSMVALGESTSRVGELSGGAAGGLTKLGTEVENAGRKAQESTGLFGKMGESISEVAKIAAGFALGAVAISAAAGVEKLFSSFSELGMATHKLQQEIGGTAEQVSGDLAVFERWGITNEQAAVSLGILSKNVTTYGDESQKAQSKATGLSGAVQSLGLSFTDASGATLPMDSILLQVANKFQAMPDGIEKTNDAMALFGRSGRDMIPMLNQGAAGLEAAKAKAAEYGLVLSEQNVQAAYKFEQAQRDLGEVVKGFAVQVGSLVIPLLTQFLSTVTTLAEKFNTSVLPVIRAVVDYVSNTFGPYIQAGLAMAGQAFGWLEGVVSSALSGVLSVVVSIGQAIADALSWLNPFATHSPSLVSSVKDGMQQVQDSYAGVTAISGPLAEAGASVTQFAGDSATALKGLVTDTKAQLAAVTDALKDAQTALTNWGKTPIEGTKAYADQLDAITTKEDQVKLRLDQIKLGNDITPQVQALNEQLKQLQFNAPQSPLGGNKQQMADFHAAMRSHQDAVRGINEQINNIKTGGSQEEIKALEDQLKNLALQKDALSLTEKLDLGPKQKALAEIKNPTPAEQPFDVIAAGMQKAQAAIATLTPQQAKLNDLLKAQQAAATAATAAHKGLGGVSEGMAATLKGVNTIIDDGKKQWADWQKQVSDAQTNITKFADSIIGPVVSAFQTLKGYLDPGNTVDLMGKIFGPDIGPAIDTWVRGVKDALGSLGDIPVQISKALSGKGLDLGAIANDLVSAFVNYVTRTLIAEGQLALGLFNWLSRAVGSIDWAMVWKKAGDIGQGILTGAGDIEGKILTWIEGAWASLKEKWPAIWAKAGDIANSIVLSAGDLLTKVEDWIKGAWASLQEKWPEIWAKAGDITSGFLTTASGILDSVVGWLKDTWARLQDKWPEIWAKAGDIASGLTIDGAALLTRVQAAIADVASKVKDSVTNLVTPAAPTEKGTEQRPSFGKGAPDRQEAGPTAALFKGGEIGPTLNPAQQMTENFKNAWPGFLATVTTAISAAATPILAQVGKWAVAFGAWVGPAALQFHKDWPKILNSILDAIGDAAGPILNQLGEWGWAFVKWIVPKIPIILLTLAEVLGAILIWIVQSVVIIEQKIETWANAWVKNAVPKIPVLLAAMRGVLEDIDAWINDQAKSIAEAAISWGAAIVSGMLLGLKDIASQIITAITTALRSITLDVGPFHLSEASFTLKAPTVDIGAAIGGAAATVTGAAASVGIAKPAPAVVTNNVTIPQTFYGTPNLADVQAASHSGVLTGLLQAKGSN